MAACEYQVTTMGSHSIPQDHGYALFSALSAKFPFLHGNKAVQIAPVRGTRTEDSHPKLLLDKHSILHIRGLTPEESNRVADSWVTLNGVPILIGSKHSKPVIPSPLLVSRQVLVKDLDNIDEYEFVTKLAELLGKMEVVADITLLKRRSLEMKSKKYIGYGVLLKGLSEGHSIKVQEHGVGWGNRFGCGVFYPGTEQR